MKVSSELSARHSENDFAEQLSILSDAGAGVIHVRTREVVRATLAIRKGVLVKGNTYHEWDVANGMREFTVDNLFKDNITGDRNVDLGNTISIPLSAIAEAEERDAYSYYVYVNPQYWVEHNPIFAYYVSRYSNILSTTNVRVVLITPDIALPDDVNDSVVSLHFDPPAHTELLAYLDDVIAGCERDVVNVSDEDKQRICFAGAGMSREAFEMYSSLAIVQAATDEDSVVGVDQIIDGINTGKTEVVNKNDILELLHPENMNDVGGMENLKQWVSRRAACYSDEAREFGVRPPKGIVFVGLPGCASGDTLINYKRGKRVTGRDITLENLYYKFNGKLNPTAGRGEARPWQDLSLPTYIQSLDSDGVVFYNRVISVIQSGIKPVVEVEVDSGEKIVLTADHPIRTPLKGFVGAGALEVGQEVVMKGSMKPVSTGGRRLDMRPYRKVVSVRYHPYATKQNRYARLVVEAHMNHMLVEEFIHALKHNAALAATFKYLSPEYDVHHMDEGTTNDELSNLMVLPMEEHARLHGKNENFNVEYTRTATVVGVRELPARMTYDVQMDMPANNFAADGFMVHNTGKSLAAKAIANELGVPLVRLDFGRVFNSLVGSSEQRVRTALRMVESMAPCVLFCVDGKTNITLADKSTLKAEDMYKAYLNGDTFVLQGVNPVTGELQELPMSRIIRTQGKPMVRISTESGKSIEVTTDHRLLVNREGGRVWVSAGELTEEDDLVEVNL